MKKILIVYLFSFLFSQNICAQTVFQTSFGLTFDTTFIRCLPDGKAVFLVGKTNINGQLKVHFLKVNRDGNLLWHKEFPLNNYNYDIKAISLQSDGILAVISGKWDAFLMKLNQETGALVWNKHFGEDENLQLYDVVCDDKDNIWLSGLHKIAPLKMDSTYYFQIKLTKNAVPIATKSSVFQTITPYQNFTQYYKPSNMVWHTASKSLISVKDIGAEFTHGFTVGPNGRRFVLMVPDSTMKYKEFYSGQNGNYIDFTSTKKYLIFSAQDIDTASKYSFGILKPDVSGHVKIHLTDGEMQPIHSNGNSLVFYSKKYKSLTKYDEELNPIWTKKYDYCLNTGVFCADIAEDGSIFTVRNVANTTVLSRLNGDGEMPNCIAYNVKSVPESNFRFIAVGFSTTIHGDYKLPIIKDSLAELRDNSVNLSPFCLKNNAIFQIPDTVCLNTSFQATRVDTMTGLKHMWAFKPNYAEIATPSFSFNSTGLKSIFHKVAINFCEDSLSQNVFVIPEPIIPLNDTILCGQKDLTIDLTAKYANAYLLNNKPINPVKTIDSSGIYTFKITTKGCVIEKKINIIDYYIKKNRLFVLL